MAESIHACFAAINKILWGPPLLTLMMLVGIYFTLRSRFYPLTHLSEWLGETLLSMRSDKKSKKNGSGISSFQALTTALASTIGTGNIVGVATALVAGGPGAIFWMWASAFFGMMTKYAEIYLAVHFRRKNEKGEWAGGPMYYLERGLSSKFLGVLFAVSCLVASFGMGNMAQSNSIATVLDATFGIAPVSSGLVIAALTMAVIFGGIRRIGKVTEALVPLMAIGYLASGLIIIAMHASEIPAAFASIVSGAFAPSSAAGGVMGYTVAQAVRFGISRGVFSNEAGLGSSSIAHAAASAKSPSRQAMWGIFEVFADTLLVCSITALAILTTGVFGTLDAAGNPVNGGALTILAFSKFFGDSAGMLIAIFLALFAFATLIGWSYYGERTVEYLFGAKYTGIYKLVFVLFIVIGSVLKLDLVWTLSDIFNALMAFPNLIGLIVLSPIVVRSFRSNKTRGGA